LIMIKQRWCGIGQFALLTDVIPDLQPDGGTQCFPLYVYDTPTEDDASSCWLPSEVDASPNARRRDAISDAGLNYFRSPCPNQEITKEDVFYYIYGILHAIDYRERYAENLRKDLPRIPRLRKHEDFLSLSQAGRALGDLHVGYESVPEYPATIEGPATPTAAQYRVEKMKFGKGKDKTTIHYNKFITVRDIPIEAYEYVVNGKSAIEWVMERQSVTVDGASGIKKDANDWAIETAGDPRYPLSLLLRVITVSLETIKIVNSLPKLDILDLDEAEPSERKVIPFRKVTPNPDERYQTCVPLVDLQAAAGPWSEVQEGLLEPDDPGIEWIEPETDARLTEGMFVAQLCGRSMEPGIPDRSYCLFRPVDLPSSPDRVVLVRHAGVTDPQSGGQFTVKRYREEVGADGGKSVVLVPENAEFEPIVISAVDGGWVQVIGEVVAVLGRANVALGTGS